ncbi:beta-glucuronidase [Nesterenkonia rhizosphaerae]|uniref:Beta-glucuronidase n=1 Tax=Nesterenkonia rhizosphaerae TaxID=1348272 RepID=A0ABP9FUB9_9MICC
MLKPKVTATREMVNLDGLWQFDTEPNLGREPWAGRLKTSREAAVPASFNDLFTDAEIRDHVGWVYYQRTVRVPRGWAGERIMIRFESVQHQAAVYLNGDLVGEHTGGYTPFDVDITDRVSAGEEFRLTVGASAELTNETIPPGELTVHEDGRREQKYFHDFYNYGGIARSVWIYSTPQQHISDITVTTDRAGSAGIVNYTVVQTGDAPVKVTLRDESGAVVAEGEGSEGKLTVQDATLWQPGAAYLYELTAELVDGGVLDSYSLNVGIRTVEVRGHEFLINGEPFYFTGFGKHEDTPVRGKGHDSAYLVHDFELIKWIGANSFRTSHYPYAEEVLDYADRQGIVVINETAAVGLNMGVVGGLTGKPPFPTFSEHYANENTQAAHAQHLRELVARDKNHPSVVMWCIANEPASNEDGAHEYFEPLFDMVRELDPTRPLTYAAVMFATPDRDQCSDLADVICLNRYYGWYIFSGQLDKAEQYLRMEIEGWLKKTDKPIMMTEYGADTQPGLHSVWDSPWTEEYQTKYLEMNHRVFDSFPQFVGEQVWNFADFQTGPGIHRVGGNKKGIFTRDRQPKAAAHYLRERWTRAGNAKPTSTEPTD